MSNYKIFITQKAQNKLENISAYIVNFLNSPSAALNLEIKLVEAILSLEINPYRAPLFSEKSELIPGKKIRKLIIGKYIILFEIVEKS